MNEPRHILSNFDKALAQLRGNLFRMAGLTAQNFTGCARALVQRDEDLCNRVIADDEEIDRLEKQIDAEGVAILTRFTPLAHDFRRVFATIKAATDLERVSDQAVGIARRAKRLLKEAQLPEAHLLEPLFAAALGLFNDSVRALSNEDMALAGELKARDRELDRLQHEVIEKITRRMEDDPANAQHYLDLVFIARFVERVGDHAVNLGEESVYSGTAKDVRHPAKPSGTTALA
jgi:phosphate transport system protein